MKIGVISRTELVKKIAKESNITLGAARTALNIVFDVLHETVRQEKTFTIPNVGTMYGRLLPEREGSHPITKEKIWLKEKKVVRIKSHYRPKNIE